ncbi:DMT family transporter [Paraburkholderia sp. Ac-20342]|uniref:DMT family transporter n=1 Tax=Paraburkholderia sp. Ac-20342 TaxID=2703889 RepID=UPI0019818626|nr:DMT family transporter [Paraburkholderia sp. Ac-20342]MBN3845559.1 DMT family transporter [Paraburkholderia sp. Ac-20342]
MATLESKAGIRINTDSTGAGIVLMIVTTAVFAASDTTVKVIGSTVPLLALLCVRYLFQVIALGIWQVRRDLPGLFRTGSLPLQMARSLLLLSNTACTFAGLRHLPLPVTTSLAMLAPLISTLLAALVLKDDVPLRKWAMVALGFIGMLLVVRPGSSQFTWTVLFPIGAATSFACYQVVSSHLSRIDDLNTTNFLTALGATVVLGVFLWLGRHDMLPALARVQPKSWLLVALMSSVATAGHLLMLQALKRAPLSLLTPFAYGQLAFAAVFSWLIFGQTPDLWTAIGMCVIAASGMGTVLMRKQSAAR